MPTEATEGKLYALSIVRGHLKLNSTLQIIGRPFHKAPIEEIP